MKNNLTEEQIKDIQMIKSCCENVSKSCLFSYIRNICECVQVLQDDEVAQIKLNNAIEIFCRRFN